MNDTLRDALTVEVRELLQQKLVLDEQRTAGTCGLTVLVVGDRRTGLRRQRSLRHLRLHVIPCSLGSLANALLASIERDREDEPRGPRSHLGQFVSPLRPGLRTVVSVPVRSHGTFAVTGVPATRAPAVRSADRVGLRMMCQELRGLSLLRVGLGRCQGQPPSRTLGQRPTDGYECSEAAATCRLLVVRTE